MAKTTPAKTAKKKVIPKSAPAKSFTARLERFYSNLWWYHVVVPDKIAKQFIVGNDRRVVCKLNNKVEFQCALMPGSNKNWFINLNKKLRDGLGLSLGTEVHVALTKDDSEYGLPVPEEFAELLKMDEEADNLFHALTKGKQRTLLHIIGVPKSADLRIKRAICIADHLKITQGKINYRQLNEAMKNAP